VTVLRFTPDPNLYSVTPSLHTRPLSLLRDSFASH